MKQKHACLLLLSVFFTFHLFAQRDKEEGEDKDGKMKAFIEKRQAFLVTNAGTENLTTVNYREWQRFNTTSKTAGYTTLNGNWGQITLNQQSTTGMGRVNCFAIQPGTPTTMWVATPSGGLWKTNNSGTNWNNYTDALPVPGVAGICIDPNLTSTLYILTGTASIVECQSIGVFKSTDGGVNWFATGLDTTRQPIAPGYGWSANKLLMDPNNSSILFACMSNGLFRTQDAGATWTNVFPGNNVKDMVFHPTNSNNIYLTTGGGQIFTSNNNGLTFSGVQNVPTVAGYPGNHSTTLAVSAAAPDSLFLCLTVAQPSYLEYVIALGKAKYDAGTNALTFGASQICKYDTGTAVHNLSHMGCALRYWRDARLSVSPTNTKDIYVGGLGTWSSNNYGKNWILKTVNESPHSDCSQMQYVGTDIYTCDDGGFYKQAGTTNNSAVPWTILTGKMPIQQIWRLGISQASTSDFFLALQDNGTHLRTASTYERWEGGDGVMAKIDPNDPSLFYGKSSDGSKVIFRYKNGIAKRLDPINSDPNEVNANFIPFEIDQNNGKNLYTAFKALYRSSDTGNTWTKYDFGDTNETRLMAVSKSNTSVIWLQEENTFIIRKTANGGSYFGVVPLPDSIPKALINNIVICPFDDNRVYLVMDGYTAGKKVYVTTNGGITWRNMSRNLPNVPIYSLAYEDVGDSSIYIGTEIGVYYFNTLINKWIPFNNGLPLCRVQELFINYTSKKLIAATYGRGIFMTDLYAGTCASTVTLTGSTNQINTYSAGTQLNSTQTVYGGANTGVKYYSGGAVTLQPGFVAQSGSGFVAAVAACGGEVDPILDKSTNGISIGQKPVPVKKPSPTLPSAKKPIPVYKNRNHPKLKKRLQKK